MPSGEEEEIAEREAPLFFFTAPAAPAFLVFLTCYPSSSRTQPAESKLDPRGPCKRPFVLRQRLFEHFVPRVKGLMLKGGARNDEAEEIAHWTLLAVWRTVAPFIWSPQAHRRRFARSLNTISE